MRNHAWKPLYALVILALILTCLAGCGTSQPAPTQPPSEEPTAPPSEEPTAPPSEEPTAAPTAEPAAPAGPTVGGTVIWAVAEEPGTLDPHLESRDASSRIEEYFGGALVDVDAEGRVIPWLAESWVVSDDGLTIDFKLREDVVFHDGTPLTAQDYAWSFSRAIDPETASTGAGTLLQELESAEAIDDSTLRLRLKSASFPLLLNLAVAPWMQPMPRATVEDLGEQFGRQPVGVGPFMFEEWVTGDRVVLARNLDYAWGSADVHEGPAYLEAIEFRFIPEYSTIIAGLEAGEIDLAEVQAKDKQRLEDTGMFQFLEQYVPGSGDFVALNTSMAPFDDPDVRKAFNLAVDRDVIIQAVYGGAAAASYGPINKATMGCWDGVEDIGYGFDLEQAESLMEQAGWVDTDDDGVREKDGQPLQLTLTVGSNFEDRVKTAQILQEQYRALGVDIQIEQLEATMVIDKVWPGNYEMAVMSMDYPEADLMAYMFHSSMIGALNMSMVNDPELDAILESTRTTMDPEARQEKVDEAQQWLVENAIVVPLYSPAVYLALSNRFQDARLHRLSGLPVFVDFYETP
jgi:peptide/nickel transport system substrate-binding protein